jgi:hypothetical protein
VSEDGVREGDVVIDRWLRRNARHDVPEAGLVLGIIALTEHDGRPYVALGTYEQATGVRDTTPLTVGEHTRIGPTLVRVEEIHLDQRAAVRVSIHRSADRQTGMTKVRVLLIVTAALLAALLAAWAYSEWRNSQPTPPMSAAEVSAGAIRLTDPVPRLPNPPTEVDVASAGTAGLSLGPMWTENGGVIARIGVTPPVGDFRLVDLRLNEPVQVGNITVRLVAAYNTTGAADVVVTATG